MKFKDAYKLLEERKKITRKDWEIDGDNLWLEIRYGPRCFTGEPIIHICSSNGHEEDWSPSYDDLFADDWVEVIDNTKEKEDMKETKKETTKKTKTVKKTQKEAKKEKTPTKKTDDNGILDFVKTNNGKIVGKYANCYGVDINGERVYITTNTSESIPVDKVKKVAIYPQTLCDEFVLLHKEPSVYRGLSDRGHGRTIYVNYNGILYCRDDSLCDDILAPESIMLDRIDTKRYANRLFGGVWTDHGLKYIAKVNGKGEWELIDNNKKED